MPTKDYFFTKTEIDHDITGNETPRQLKIAVAAILCEMAHADDTIDRVESAKIMAMMDKEFHLERDESEDIRRVAEMLIEDRSKIDEFIDHINLHFAPEQKNKVYDMAWAVAQADGNLDTYEKFFAKYLRVKLELY
jgi:uncharacterized tellurite resistance protein B-like protein